VRRAELEGIASQSQVGFLSFLECLRSVRPVQAHTHFKGTVERVSFTLVLSSNSYSWLHAKKQCHYFTYSGSYLNVKTAKYCLPSVRESRG
jgi:hypothetical protein